MHRLDEEKESFDITNCSLAIKFYLVFQDYFSGSKILSVFSDLFQRRECSFWF